MYEVENDKIRVKYKIEKDSFSHPFGVQKIETTEIEKIEVYVPANDSWIDVTHNKDFDNVAMALIESDGAQQLE
jgi:hypothetical protein